MSPLCPTCPSLQPAGPNIFSWQLQEKQSQGSANIPLVNASYMVELSPRGGEINCARESPSGAAATELVMTGGGGGGMFTGGLVLCVRTRLP